MPETKTKKVRVYKLASEYNLSAENLIEFLQKKGHEVKSHMSMLSDDMIKDINAHFKKDIEKAEKHYKKIAEFNKKREEKVEEEEQKSIKDEPEPEQIEVAKEDEAAEIPVEEETEEQLAEEVEVGAQAEIVQEQVEAAVETPGEEAVTKEEEPEFKAPSEKEKDKKRGLKVIGKMDLGEEEKKKTLSDANQGKDEKPKKKRKKPKARKKSTEQPDDQTPTKKRKRIKRFEIDEKEVKAAIKKTLLSMDDSVASGRASARKKKRREREAEEERRLEEKNQEKKTIAVNEFIAVSELANLMGVPVSDVIQKFIELGLMVSINQRLDVDTITLVADEFGFDVKFQEEYTSEALEDFEDDPESLESRPPIVTIMGHVDHGKTSLLDYIRRTNVVAGESGGITQHIGAYKVDVGNGKKITFLDTPGHEAFTAMRARGAQLTDIVVLIIAADDAVMPQTIEAINHAQAANVPIVIAINKIDKPGANSDKIKQQLADRKILVEDWGGKYQCVEVSAKTGLNVENLLEVILLEAELLDLKANPNRNARGTVVESELDKGRGITGTILVQKGTLKIGDPFVAGIYQGKVRAMFDERGNKVDEAPPATPVLVLGFEGAPQAGDTFVGVESERQAREIGIKRQQLKREQDQKQVHHITLEEIGKQISIGGVKELPLIVKGDVDGSVEALSDSLMKLSNEEVVVRVIHKGVGGISESDVLLADASDAIIIGFHVRPHLNARKLAESQNVDIRLYNVIYDAINEVKAALEGLLSPLISEEVTATLEIRDTFKVPKMGTIAGCYVQEGKISRNSKVRLIREGIVIHSGEIASLKRFKDDVREVDAGYECGLNIANYNDIKVGDVIEAYKIVETKKKLA
ncbi:MAG: translation initiation factor IF-2 [Ignavibacteriaceae bacterium]